MLLTCSGFVLPSIAFAAAKLDTITVNGKCNFWDGNVYYACAGHGGGGSAGGGGSNRPVSGGGGGGGGRPSPGAKEQETHDKQLEAGCDGETSGNPVVLYTGNKVEPELDFASGGEMGLFLQRTYNHFWNGIGVFGKHWLSNFDYSLAFSTGTAWAQRPDGRRVKFRQTSANRWDEDRAQPVAHIVRNADGTYTLHNEERGTEVYDTAGYILERRNEQGIAWSFTYSNHFLQRVTHSSGRYVQLGWSDGQLTQVTDPAGNVYRYTYTPHVFGGGRGRLASAILPGAPETTIAYHYEDARFPGALTGKSFNGARYSTFAYDSQQRAISTEHAGGVERYTFTYAVEAEEQLPLPPPTPAPGGFHNDEERGGCYFKGGRWGCFQPVWHGGASVYNIAFLGVASLATTLASSASTHSRPTRFRVTETNPLGRKTTHLYEDGKKVSVTGDASPKCGASYRELTYDANGYEDIASDDTGRLTDFDYDPHGHLVKQVEAAGTPSARTTTQEWDEANNRLTRVTVAGETDTRLAYTPEGRIASVAVTTLSGKDVAGRTLKTTYTYTRHANGLLASVSIDGPLANDTTTSTFSPSGDLLSVRDGLGLVTTYAAHNGLGQTGRVIAPDGATTDYTYDARGRVVASSVTVDGVAHTTRYAYDGSGLLASIQGPDGPQQRLVYDAALRPIEAYEREPDGTYARKRTTYDALSQPLAIELHRTAYPHDTSITGHLEGVLGNGAGGFEVRGWACTTGQDAHINVELYVGGAAPTGAFIDRHAANRTSEAAVATACAAHGSAYRFAIPLSDATRDAHGGKALHAHGISPAGKANSVIAGSGLHAVPRLKPIVAPAGLSAPAQSTAGSYTVAWSAAPRATAYKLEESANGGAWVAIHNAAATSVAVTGKAAGTYRYRVAACNESGCGPDSAERSVVEIDPPQMAPSTPSAPAVNTSGSYTVGWNAVADATSYRLEESANGGAWTQVHDAAATSKAFAGKSTAIPHGYRVRACNPAGCSAYSGSALVQRTIHDAQVLGHDAPSGMLLGDVATVTVTVRNAGNVTWPVGGVYLGRPPGAFGAMPAAGVPLVAPVAPGGTATFRYSVHASSATAFWVGGQMAANGVGFFGPLVPTRTVHVENPNGTCSGPTCEAPR